MAREKKPPLRDPLRDPASNDVLACQGHIRRVLSITTERTVHLSRVTYEFGEKAGIYTGYGACSLLQWRRWVKKNNMMVIKRGW